MTILEKMQMILKSYSSEDVGLVNMKLLNDFVAKFIELQKQVDELTIVNTNLIKRINRTVKDTPKKIEDKIQELLYTPFEGKTEKQKYQRKGMEEGLKMALEIVKEKAWRWTDEYSNVVICIHHLRSRRICTFLDYATKHQRSYKMDKKKQISTRDRLMSIICNDELVDYLIESGLIIPENAVVLMREEYEKTIQEKLKLGMEMGKRQARKETTEKFAKMVKELLEQREYKAGCSAHMMWTDTAKSCVDEVANEIMEGE